MKKTERQGSEGREGIDGGPTVGTLADTGPLISVQQPTLLDVHAFQGES